MRAKVQRDPLQVMRRKMQAAKERRPDHKWARNAAQVDRERAVAMTTRRAQADRMTPGTRQKPGQGQTRGTIIRTNGPTRSQFKSLERRPRRSDSTINMSAHIALWNGRRQDSK